MGKWLAAFAENYQETPTSSTDNTASTHVMAVTSVQVPVVFEEKTVDRWNPELADEGYVWCLDCKHFDNVNCHHTDNPFHTIEKQPLAPRKCQWYEISNLI